MTGYDAQSAMLFDVVLDFSTAGGTLDDHHVAYTLAMAPDAKLAAEAIAYLEESGQPHHMQENGYTFEQLEAAIAAFRKGCSPG